MISPSSIYMNWGGVLLGEMLNEEGFNFALSYFDFDKGTYLKDYERVFNVAGDRMFTVKDTWGNYGKIFFYTGKLFHHTNDGSAFINIRAQTIVYEQAKMFGFMAGLKAVKYRAVRSNSGFQFLIIQLLEV